ncbi:MAG: Sec-independent protein translocase protein TatB [Gammaproteobacteria bacterium]|nr:Sec-independent protein translocase protein TatB [Gammaproteobacteria bacterium]
MFEVGFWEILLILILALVVIGPERLPGAARTLGLWVGKGRRYIEGVKSEVEQEFDVSEFKRVIRNQEIQLNELQQKVSQSARMSADDLLGSHEITHNIKEETPVAEEKSISEKKNPE